MIIGDPYKFAIMFQKIDAWNENFKSNNGVFAIFIDGKMFPNNIDNTTLPVAIEIMKDRLINIPIDDKIYSMDKEKAFETLYDIDKSIEETNYYKRFEIEVLIDNNCLIYGVKSKKKIRILASTPIYDKTESCYILSDSSVYETIIEEEELKKIINKLERKV